MTAQAEPGRSRSDRKILLHTCCAPCLTMVHNHLRVNGYEVTSFFYNPNIHPFHEYEKRLASLKIYASLAGLKLLADEAYDIENFFPEVDNNLANRCELCYRLRLTRTAEVAKEMGFKVFSTTLLISPYQKHDLIKAVGESVARERGLEFFYDDWRPLYHHGREVARQMGLYRQRYCGCLFSEKDRFFNQKLQPPEERGEDRR